LRQEEKRDDLKDQRMIKSAVGQHESHDHKGEPKTKLKLRRGGKVEGDKPQARADRPGRYAAGGATMPERSKGRGAPKGHKPAVSVNIISPAAAEGEKRQAAQAGMQAGAKLGAAAAMRAPHPAAPPPSAGGPPGAGGPPMAPPGAEGGMPPGQPPMRRGGGIRP
jgi:hypothetical protein